MIVLDTNIVIGFLGNDDAVVKKLNQALRHNEELLIPTIVLAEILSYPGLDQTLLVRTEQLITSLSIIELNRDIAVHAATIRRATRLKLIDCIVAATAQSYLAALATRDREFKKIPDLKVLRW